MATAPQLTATPSGDVLELRPGGSWTAANVTALEGLSNGVAAELDRSRAVKLDMAGVQRTRHARCLAARKDVAARCHRAEMVGVADNYAGLIEEVRQVNRHNPAPAPAPNPLVAKVSDLGARRDRLDGRRDRVPADAGLRCFGRSSACCAGRDRCG